VFLGGYLDFWEVLQVFPGVYDHVFRRMCHSLVHDLIIDLVDCFDRTMEFCLFSSEKSNDIYAVTFISWHKGQEWLTSSYNTYEALGPDGLKALGQERSHGQQP